MYEASTRFIFTSYKETTRSRHSTKNIREATDLKLTMQILGDLIREDVEAKTAFSNIAKNGRKINLLVRILLEV